MLLPKMTSARELQRNYRQLAELVKKTNKPLIIMKNNKPDVVLIDFKHLEAMEKIKYKLEEMEALEAIRIFEEEKKEGKLKKASSLTELLDED